MPLPTISICTIVKNEEKQLKAYLDSIVHYADEIIAVDTGSSDGSLSILKDFEGRYPDKVHVFQYETPGPFHFGRARNFTIDHATADYCLALDVDERLSTEFKQKFAAFLADGLPVIVLARRVDELLPHLIDQTARIVLRKSSIRYGTGEDCRVHEQLAYQGEVKAFLPILWHCQRDNHYLERPQRIFPQLELQIERVPRTKSFFGHLLRGIWYFSYRFKKIYWERKLYKDGRLGFKYAFLRSLDAFLVQLFVGLKPRPGHSYLPTIKNNDR